VKAEEEAQAQAQAEEEEEEEEEEDGVGVGVAGVLLLGVDLDEACLRMRFCKLGQMHVKDLAALGRLAVEVADHLRALLGRLKELFLVA